MRSPRRALLIPILLLALSTLRAQEPEDDRDLPPAASILGADSAAPRGEAEDYGLLGVRLDLIATPGSGPFFDDYRLLFGRSRELDITVMPALGGRFRLSRNLRATVFGSWASSGFSEVYDAYRFPADTTVLPADTLIPAAQIGEDMAIRGFLLLAGLEYSPVPSQFSSYVGASAGVGIIRTTWRSSTRVFGNVAYARPEINVENTRPFPAIRLYSGVDLQFDHAGVNGSIVRGVYVEASWLWLAVTEDFFGPIRRTSQNLPVLPPEEDSRLNLGGFAIGIGLSLQLLPD